MSMSSQQFLIIFDMVLYLMDLGFDSLLISMVIVYTVPERKTSGPKLLSLFLMRKSLAINSDQSLKSVTMALLKKLFG